MLLDFVAEHYPDLLAVYCSYEVGVQRADAARYMLLHHFGGVYADLDCECVAPFDAIMHEDRVVLCHEPDQHERDQMGFRNLPYLLFNGTMASPKEHPFWSHLLAYLPSTKDARDVVDATGPCLLTAAQLSYPNQDAFTLYPCDLFAPNDRDGELSTGIKNGASPTLSVHHWAGTWWIRDRKPSAWNRLRRQFFRARHHLTKGPQLDIATAQAAVDKAALECSPPPGGNIAILVPLRDAADHIEPFLAAIAQLDYPKDRIKLVFCEGDSQDGSWDRLAAATAPLKGRYRDVILLRKELGTQLDRTKRWMPKMQRVRRAGIAAVRNHLIDHGLDASDDWTLWIDIDVWCIPRDVITRMIRTGRRIIAPNCVKAPGGPSFDLNSFVTVKADEDHRYFRAMLDGLFQPPADYAGRLHMSDLRHLESVNLDGVGGAMLLVDAALHRGGLRFPEIPYKFLIETEGFAALARDLGVIPLGLPRVEVLHVPW